MTHRTQAEDAALDRLLATDVGTGRLRAYGDEPDQVWESWGSADDPVVVVVHGGYFRPTIDRTHARPMAAALARTGLCVVLAEYRRRPGDPDASVADLAALDAQLRSRGVVPEAWVGHSAGGTLVMLHGLLAEGDRPGSARIIALAPVSALARSAREGLGDGAIVEWVGGAPGAAEAYARLDPQHLLQQGRRCAGGLVILHGSEDATVPADHTRALPVPSTILPGAHHFDVVDPESPHFAQVLAAIRGRSPVG